MLKTLHNTILVKALDDKLGYISCITLKFPKLDIVTMRKSMVSIVTPSITARGEGVEGFGRFGKIKLKNEPSWRLFNFPFSFFGFSSKRNLVHPYFG
jgi:hypothetical protein